MGRSLPGILALAAVLSACAPRAREYELRGVVVAVDAGRKEITIKHDDIPRFMPAMTMPFTVKERDLLLGRAPGDLVRATLVVDGSDAHLRTLERIGSAPIPDPPAAARPELLAPGEPLPDAELVDQSGTVRRVSEWRGQALAVTFIYTRCPIPNFCPLMDRHFQAAQHSIAQDPQLRGRARLLSVSFDPARDSPAVLAARARQLGADPTIWSLLTGAEGDVERFASRFGVSIIRDDARAEDIVHNLRTVIVDPGGRLSKVLRGNEWTPEELTADLRKVVAGG